MRKPHLYILQLAGIFMLVCCYLLSDQPDSLSIMNINISSGQSISAPGSHSKCNQPVATISATSHPSKRSVYQKYITGEVSLPTYNVISTCFFADQPTHTQKIGKSYEFLYYKEINPPPPKC